MERIFRRYLNLDNCPKILEYWSVIYFRFSVTPSIVDRLTYISYQIIILKQKTLDRRSSGSSNYRNKVGELPASPRRRGRGSWFKVIKGEYFKFRTNIFIQSVLAGETIQQCLNCWTKYVINGNLIVVMLSIYCIWKIQKRKKKRQVRINQPNINIDENMNEGKMK